MDVSAVADRNVRWFLAFRVLFNSRFYYPVMAILFLDLGLSMEQYTLLNVVWAATIVLLEVPSGAMADLVGRKLLVVYAAILMVLEMAIFAFTPAGNLTLMFWLFMLNRVVSGAAEAAASGADEALVYDSLKASGRESEWPQVLSRLSRWQSAGFFLAMILGAAIYDPNLANRALGWIGFESHLTSEDTVRWPVYLTLCNSLVAVLAASRMIEPAMDDRKTVSAGAAFNEVLAAGRWILATPVALFVILAAICNDSVIRLFLTIGAQYYRLIQIPEAAFGLIGSTLALLGYVAPPIARRLISQGSPVFTYVVICMVTFTGLLGLSWVWPYAGLLFPMLLGIAMSVLGFSTSYYLNEIAEPSRRATILSFRGLSINLAYGMVGFLFATLLRTLREVESSGNDDTLFVSALSYLPWFFVIVAIVLLSKPALTVKRLL